MLATVNVILAVEPSQIVSLPAARAIVPVGNSLTVITTVLEEAVSQGLLLYTAR